MKILIFLLGCQTSPNQIKTSAEFNAEHWAINLGYTYASANCSPADPEFTQFVTCTIRTESSVLITECPYVKFIDFNQLYGSQPYCFIKENND